MSFYNQFNIINEVVMSIRPLHDRVAIKPIAQEDRTAGGIIIPDTAKEKPMKGEVVAVGSGSKSDNGNVIPLELKVGDVVLFGKWGGTEIKFDGQDLVIMKESDILAIIK
jgi:chaperonin GroES